MANLITLGRVVLLFVAMGLLYWEGPTAKVVAFFVVLFVIWMDALDGQIARIYHEESDLGGVMDITGDRIVENVLWICFAHKQLISVWVPVIVITRGFITDSIRSLALTRGMTAFGEKSMMSSRWGRFLVASRFSRAAYGVLKTIVFGYILLLVAMEDIQGKNHVEFLQETHGLWLWWVSDVLVAATVIFCLVRGVPVILDGRGLFRHKKS